METLCIYKCSNCSKELVMRGIINDCNHPVLALNAHPLSIRRFKEPKPPKRLKMLRSAPVREMKKYVDLSDEEDSAITQSDIGGPSTSTPSNLAPVEPLQLPTASSRPMQEEQCGGRSIKSSLWAPPSKPIPPSIPVPPSMPIPEEQCRPKPIKTTLWNPPVGNQTVTFSNKSYPVPGKIGRTSINNSINNSNCDSEQSMNYIDNIIHDTLKSDYINL